MPIEHDDRQYCSVLWPCWRVRNPGVSVQRQAALSTQAVQPLVRTLALFIAGTIDAFFVRPLRPTETGVGVLLLISIAQIWLL